MLKLPSNIEMDWIFILGGLAKLRKVNISFVMSVRPHWTTRLPQYRMSRNLTYWVFFDYTCIWVRKLDSDSLTEMKNWSGRNEVIRTWLAKLITSKYVTELIFSTLLFADDQFIISDPEDNLQQAVYLLHKISKEYNLKIATKKTKVFGFVRTPMNKNYYKRWNTRTS